MANSAETAEKKRIALLEFGVAMEKHEWELWLGEKWEVIAERMRLRRTDERRD